MKNNANYAWDPLETFCNITESDIEPFCREHLNLGASCVGGALPSNLGGEGVLYYNSFYADVDDRRCYRSDMIGVNTTGRFSEYVATGNTTLRWENFSASGGSISGYNIYRKLGIVSKSNNGATGSDNIDDPKLDVNIHVSEFNVHEPIATLDGGNHTSFTDNFESTRHPPVPGTVYFYEVRHVVEGVLSNLFRKNLSCEFFLLQKFRFCASMDGQ